MNITQAIQKSYLSLGSHGTHTRQLLSAVAFVQAGRRSASAVSDTQFFQLSAQPGVRDGSVMSVARLQHLPAQVVLSYDAMLVLSSPGNGICGESEGTYGSSVLVA